MGAGFAAQRSLIGYGSCNRQAILGSVHDVLRPFVLYNNNRVMYKACENHVLDRHLSSRWKGFFSAKCRQVGHQHCQNCYGGSTKPGRHDEQGPSWKLFRSKHWKYLILNFSCGISGRLILITDSFRARRQLAPTTKRVWLDGGGNVRESTFEASLNCTTVQDVFCHRKAPLFWSMYSWSKVWISREPSPPLKHFASSMKKS